MDQTQQQQQGLPPMWPQAAVSPQAMPEGVVPQQPMQQMPQQMPAGAGPMGAAVMQARQAEPEPEPEPQMPQASFGEYVAGIRTTCIDVDRQYTALLYFSQVLRQINALANDPEADVGRLPFIPFTFPTDDDKPGEYKLDMNALSAEEVLAFRGLISIMVENISNSLCRATNALYNSVAGAKQITDHASAQRNATP
jgi:hypothetical protein